MENEEAIAALLEGKKLRQADWKDGEYIFHYKDTSLNAENILETHQGVKFRNYLGLVIPLAQEEMQACLNRNLPFEVYALPEDAEEITAAVEFTKKDSEFKVTPVETPWTEK